MHCSKLFTLMLHHLWAFHYLGAFHSSTIFMVIHNNYSINPWQWNNQVLNTNLNTTSDGKIWKKVNVQLKINCKSPLFPLWCWTVITPKKHSHMCILVIWAWAVEADAVAGGAICSVRKLGLRGMREHGGNEVSLSAQSQDFLETGMVMTYFQTYRDYRLERSCVKDVDERIC